VGVSHDDLTVLRGRPGRLIQAVGVIVELAVAIGPAVQASGVAAAGNGPTVRSWSGR